MQRVGWAVISTCGVCHPTMSVDLAVIIRLKGHSVSLWNRKAKCRRIGCLGEVRFFAQHAPGRGYELLAADWPTP